jgi:hypothetical protein
LLWLCCLLGPEATLQALRDLEANERFQLGDTLIQAPVVPHARRELQLLVVLLIVERKAVIALVGFGQASVAPVVLFEKVAPVAAPALSEQIDPAFAHIEAEDVVAPA